MCDTSPEPSALEYAIGDLGVARRHLRRLIVETLPVSPAIWPMILVEIAASIERCVTRLELLNETYPDIPDSTGTHPQ